MIKLLVVAAFLYSSGIATASDSDAAKLHWRPGFTYLALDASSSEVSINGINTVASLGLSEGPVRGSGVSVDGGRRFSVVVAYRFSDNWSIETVIAPPFKLDLGFNGTLSDQSIAPTALGFVPTGIKPFGPTLGTVNSLPFVVTVTRALKRRGDWRPYYGFGITYVYTYDATLKNPVLLESGRASLDVGSDSGVVLQFGTSWLFTENLEFTFDFKYGAGLSLDGEVRNITLESPGLSSLIGSATADSATVNLSLQAYVANISVRWRF